MLTPLHVLFEKIIPHFLQLSIKKSNLSQTKTVSPFSLYVDLEPRGRIQEIIQNMESKTAMIYIAVCDDELNIGAEIEQVLEAFMDGQRLSMRLTFAHPEAERGKDMYTFRLYIPRNSTKNSRLIFSENFSKNFDKI